MTLEPLDRRSLVGEKRSERVANYYRDSGILAVMLDLKSRDYSQDEIAQHLTSNGFANSDGLVSWTQASVCKIIQRAKRRGDIF